MCVCVCVCVCVRACVRACERACVRACVRMSARKGIHEKQEGESCQRHCDVGSDKGVAGGGRGKARGGEGVGAGREAVPTAIRRTNQALIRRGVASTPLQVSILTFPLCGHRLQPTPASPSRSPQNIIIPNSHLLVKADEWPSSVYHYSLPLTSNN